MLFVCTKSSRFLTIVPSPAPGMVKSAIVPGMARLPTTIFWIRRLASYTGLKLFCSTQLVSV
jgi:hypothetical protein